jgi:hypothetical protein
VAFLIKNMAAAARAHQDPKTVVPVVVVGIPVVAVGAARVPLIIVERAPAHHAAVVSSRPLYR